MTLGRGRKIRLVTNDFCGFYSVSVGKYCTNSKQERETPSG